MPKNDHLPYYMQAPLKTTKLFLSKPLLKPLTGQA